MSQRQAIYTKQAPEPIGAYSQAVKVGSTVYLSGQIPLCPKTGQLISQDIHEQVQQVFTNLRVVCQAAGGDFSAIAKLTVYLIDLNDFSVVNDAMVELFSEPYPARAVVEVSALPKGSAVEVEAILQL